MKIALLNTQDNGGAGKAALRLNNALNDCDYHSRLFVKNKFSDSNKVIQISHPDINSYLFDSVINTFHKHLNSENTISSLMYPAIGFDYLEFLNSYNVVNLHWLPSFISIESIMKISSMGKRIFWTLHDQNAYTGACHYSHGCDRYLTDCHDCPQIHNGYFDLSQKVLEAKRKYLPSDITIIAPSKWIGDTARSSALFRNNRIECISNCIETGIYKPSDKKSAKAKLGLPENAKVILFGAWDVREKRKGASHLLHMARYLIQNTKVKQALEQNLIHVLIFGEGTSFLQDLCLPYKALGYIKKDEDLAQIYAASDVLALPSLEDNLPNLMLESLSCGVPVASYNIGGIKDTIQHGGTGLLCEPGDIVGLAENIAQLLFSGDKLSANCREYAQKHFSMDTQAKRYYTLYEDVLSKPPEEVKSSVYIPRVVPEIAGDLAQFMIEGSYDVFHLINQLKADIYGKDHQIHTLGDQTAAMETRLQTAEADKIQLNQVISDLNQQQLKFSSDIDFAQKESRELRQQNSELAVQVSNLDNSMRQIEEKNSFLQNKIAELQQMSLKYEQINEQQLLQIGQLTEQLESAQDYIENANLEKEELILENVKLKNTVSKIEVKQFRIKNSISWKITKPMRFLFGYVRKIIKFVTPYALVKLYQSKNRCDQ